MWLPRSSQSRPTEVVSEARDPSFPRSAAGISMSSAPRLGPEEARPFQSLCRLLTFVPSATRYPRRSAGMTEQQRSGGLQRSPLEPGTQNAKGEKPRDTPFSFAFTKRLADHAPEGVASEASGMYRGLLNDQPAWHKAPCFQRCSLWNCVSCPVQVYCTDGSRSRWTPPQTPSRVIRPAHRIPAPSAEAVER